MFAIDQLILLVAVLIAGTWLGSMFFLSAVMAPVVFRVLSTQGASLFLRAMFPRYYKVGIGCGIGLVILMLLLMLQTSSFSATTLWATAGAICITLLGGYSLALIPRINLARDAGSRMKKEFDRLHRLSVIINLVNILITMAILSVIFLMPVIDR